MAQEHADKVGQLKAAVAGLPSGSLLISALEAAPTVPGSVIELVIKVLHEVKGSPAAANGGAPAVRRSLETAASVINQLMFLSPR